MRFVSIDPSLSNTAIVWGEIVDGKIVPENWRIVASKKSAAKMPVMQDRLNRIKDIFAAVDEVLLLVKPDVTFGELPTGSQSSSASVGVGCSLSILAKLPNLTVVTALEVKKVVAKGVVSKDDVMDYCVLNFPDFPFEKKKDGTLVKARMEHVCDSVAIGIAGLNKLKENKIKDRITRGTEINEE